MTPTMKALNRPPVAIRRANMTMLDLPTSLRPSNADEDTERPFPLGLEGAGVDDGGFAACLG